MIAKVFRLILAKLRIRPIRSLDVPHALEQGRPRDVHFAKDGILQIGSIELGHFDVAKGHIGTLEIRSVHGGVEEASPHEVRATEIAIPDDALLERNAPEVRPLEVGSVEVDSAGYRDRATALQRGGPARRDLAVGGDRRARIVRGGGDDDHGRRGGEEADGEGD